AEVRDTVAGKSKLPEKTKPLYRRIVFAAGWQESCWRQYIRKGKEVTPLASAAGDVGLMQVNRNTWRGVYDVKGLGGDIAYNGNAGGEILLYYLTRYAIRKNEDKQPGGNLARATYSSYNGGPSHLTRYRAAKPNPTLKKVDEAFWERVKAVSSGREMDVLSCYRTSRPSLFYRTARRSRLISSDPGSSRELPARTLRRIGRRERHSHRSLQSQFLRP